MAQKKSRKEKHCEADENEEQKQHEQAAVDVDDGEGNHTGMTASDQKKKKKKKRKQEKEETEKADSAADGAAGDADQVATPEDKQKKKQKKKVERAEKGERSDGAVEEQQAYTFDGATGNGESSKKHEKQRKKKKRKRQSEDNDGNEADGADDESGGTGTNSSKREKKEKKKKKKITQQQEETHIGRAENEVGEQYEGGNAISKEQDAVAAQRASHADADEGEQHKDSSMESDKEPLQTAEQNEHQSQLQHQSAREQLQKSARSQLPKQQAFAAAENGTKVLVGNLAWSVEDEMLRNDFSDCGEVEDAFIVRNKEDKTSKGFGFVSFKTVEAAQRALEYDGSQYSGRPLKVQLAKPKAEQTPSGPGTSTSTQKGPGSKIESVRTIFIKNLPKQRDEEEQREAITEAFNSVGDVSRVRLPCDRENNTMKVLDRLSLPGFPKTAFPYSVACHF